MNSQVLNNVAIAPYVKAAGYCAIKYEQYYFFK